MKGKKNSSIIEDIYSEDEELDDFKNEKVAKDITQQFIEKMSKRNYNTVQI